MKRTILGGALFAAPLIAGTLFAGVVSADPSNIIALQLDSVCSNASTNQGVFAAQNKNDFPIEISWTNLDNGHTGSFTAPANSFDNFATYYDASDPNNTTSFTADGWTSPAVTNVQTAPCDDDTLAGLPVTGGNGSGSTGGTVTTPVDTGTGSTTTTTTDNGGKGGDVASATTAAAPVVATAPASLADTGASQIMPYSIAALLAVATIGMTVAVRKNVL